MKVKDQIIRKFVAEDGSEFDTEKACYDHELKLAKKAVGVSQKYVIGTIYNDGTGYFSRYRYQEYKTVPPRYIHLGGTSNVKYAYKFSSFEEAFKRGGDRVLTLEEAQKASEIAEAKRKKKDEREQRYVKVFTHEHLPAKAGEYITNLGVSTYEVDGWKTPGWGSIEPQFWMSKVNKTAK